MDRPKRLFCLIMELIFATGNPNKIKEVAHLLGNTFKVGSLTDINCPTDLPETHETLEENAIEKASYVYDNYKKNCFSEDTGLEVAALNGEPGVYSARYAGGQKDNQANMNLLLSKLEGEEDRSARFRTVIALILDGTIHTFEGIVNGKIITERRGKEGFGYDPIFVPDGYKTTFAEMQMGEKSRISHRGRAVAKLVEFLGGLD